MFASLPNLTANHPLIASSSVLNDIPESHQHFINAPAIPVTPKSIFEALKTQYSFNWKAAAFNQFLKNHDIAVFTLPFPASKLPPDAQVFWSQLVPEIKVTDVQGVLELKIRHVIVGTPQQRYVDYDNAYALMADFTTIHCKIAICSSKNYFLSIIDVKNAFQHTIAPVSSHIYTTMPPLYKEFLHKFLNYYEFPVKTHYLQMLNSNQGTQDAGNLWCQLLMKVLLEYGFICSTIDHAYFVKTLPNDDYIYVTLATDDLLSVGCPSKHIFQQLKQHLQKYFELSIQDGLVLKFLGLQIIQTNIGVSMDQGEYTYELVEHYFGSAVDKLKKLSTPMHYDNDFEFELYESIPLV